MQSVEQLYCALNLEQIEQSRNSEAANKLHTGGSKLPEAGVYLLTNSKGNIPQAPATYGIFPGEKGNGSFRGPAGIFPGGWHADHPQAGLHEEQSPPSKPTTSNLTPGESQHASSATSYSPRIEDDRMTNRADSSASATTFSIFPNSQDGMNMGKSSKHSDQDDNSNGSFPMPKEPSGRNDAYAFTPGRWDFSSGTESTPLASGMSLNTGGHWSNPSVQPLPAWSNSQSTEESSNVDWKVHQRDPPQYGYKSGFLMNTGIPDPNGKDPFQIDFYNDSENVDQSQRH